MGIRFACHHCNHPLNLKDFQAGKRGKCPACGNSFRIPKESCDFSIPLEESTAERTTIAPAVLESSMRAASVGTAIGESVPKAASKKSDLVTKSKTKIPVKNRTPSPVENTAAKEVSAVIESAQPMSSADMESASKPEIPHSTEPEDRVVAAFQANPLAQWYVRPPSGGQYGPADSKLLSQWISESRVTADSLIWFEGLTQWTAAGTVLPELFSNASPASFVNRNNPDSVSPAGPADGGANGNVFVNTATLDVAAKPIRNRQKQKRTQWVIITLLISLCLCLLVGLVAVLTLNK